MLANSVAITIDEGFSAKGPYWDAFIRALGTDDFKFALSLLDVVLKNTNTTKQQKRQLEREILISIGDLDDEKDSI